MNEGSNPSCRTKFKKMEIKKAAWDNFLKAIDWESNTSNFKYDFKIMSKKYGMAYIEYCKAMYNANKDIQSDDEFCQMNGNMPIGFFNKVIKK